MEPVNLSVTKNELAQMTGRQLARTIGLIDPDGCWLNNEHTPFHLNGTPWTAYTTRGRGKNRHTSYLHIYRPVKLRVVDPDGHDTGMRVDDYDHMRGKLSDPLETYDWVS